MIYKVDYSLGVENRNKLPKHAILDPYKKGKCYAFFYKKDDVEVPVDAKFVPIDEKLPMSRNNYMIKFL